MVKVSREKLTESLEYIKVTCEGKTYDTEEIHFDHPVFLVILPSEVRGLSFISDALGLTELEPGIYKNIFYVRRRVTFVERNGSGSLVLYAVRVNSLEEAISAYLAQNTLINVDNNEKLSSIDPNVNTIRSHVETIRDRINVALSTRASEDTLVQVRNAIRDQTFACTAFGTVMTSPEFPVTYEVDVYPRHIREVQISVQADGTVSLEIKWLYSDTGADYQNFRTEVIEGDDIAVKKDGYGASRITISIGTVTTVTTLKYAIYVMYHTRWTP